jgi:hypothetical protein
MGISVNRQLSLVRTSIALLFISASVILPYAEVCAQTEATNSQHHRHDNAATARARRRLVVGGVRSTT